MDVQETELIGIDIMQGYCESVEPLLDISPYSDFSQSCININKIPFVSDLRSEYNCDSKDNSPNPMFLPLYMRKSADILGLSVFKLVNFRLKYAKMLVLFWITLAALTLSTYAGTRIWDGSFNNFTSAADFDNCTFSHWHQRLSTFLVFTRPAII